LDTAKSAAPLIYSVMAIKTKRTFKIIIGVAVVITVLLLLPPVQMVLGVLLFGIPTAGDADACIEVTDELEASHDFKHYSVSAPDRKAIFCTPGSNNGLFSSSPKLILYFINNNEEQDVIISKTKDIINNIDLNAISIEFYEKENWTTYKDSQGKIRGGSRGIEIATRTYEVTKKP
jgi:hypothetical protein